MGEVQNKKNKPNFSKYFKNKWTEFQKKKKLRMYSEYIETIYIILQWMYLFLIVNKYHPRIPFRHQQGHKNYQKLPPQLNFNNLQRNVRSFSL